MTVSRDNKTRRRLYFIFVLLLIGLVTIVALTRSNDSSKQTELSDDNTLSTMEQINSSDDLWSPDIVSDSHSSISSHNINNRLLDESIVERSKKTISTMAPSQQSTKMKWTVKIRGGSQEADEIAESLDCNNLGLVKGFLHTYLFEKRSPANSTHLTRDKRDFIETTDRLKSHENVIWAEQQTILIRVKRSPTPPVHLLPSRGANTQHDEARARSVRARQHRPRSSVFALDQHNYRPAPQHPSNSMQMAHGQSALNGPYSQQSGQHNIQLQMPQYGNRPTQFAPATIQPQQTHQPVQMAPSTGRMILNWHLLATSDAPRPTLTSGPVHTLASGHSANINGPSSSGPNTNNNQAISNYDSATTNKQQQVSTSDKQPATLANNNNNNKLLNDRYDDELWTHQWYLHNNSESESDMNLHVQEAWTIGLTGKNVVVTVIDDGLEWNHTDLIDNYDPMASYDMNNNRADPYPRYDTLNKQNHGTRCAGEIAMVANNKKCGIGVAPNARIGGIKILDGEIDEHIEAMSLIHNLNHIDIYSASWGPRDDGMTVEGPKLTQAQAIRDGIERGRRGLGAIYIWASGNGGIDGDNCNCDGYVGSLYTMAIGSASQRGHFPYFGERCASILAVTCSSGTLTDKKVTTTDLHNRCTTNFVGTSAAAPLAAGIMALVLEANPNITWRDAQHLVAWNSDYYPLRDNTGWFRNSAGLMFNNKFGFGLMNAKLLVESALNWQNVPPKSICTIVTSDEQGVLPDRISTGAPALVLHFHTNDCQYDNNNRKDQPFGQHQQSAGQINYLEHVELIATIEYPTRGDLELFLTSPMGTTSNILTYRPRDKAMMGFTDWTFMSVHFWGEQPQGSWTLRVRDKHRGQSKINSGYLVNATLLLHGTKIRPAHMNRPRCYMGEDHIEATLEKSIVHVDPATGLKTHDENPWDQNTYPQDISPVSNDDSEDRSIKA